MIATILKGDTLNIRLNEDGSPMNRFLRVDLDDVQFKYVQFQLFNSKSRMLILEQMAVKKPERRRLSFTAATGADAYFDTVTIDCPLSGGCLRYHVEDDKVCTSPGYIQFSTPGLYRINIQTVLTKWTIPSEFIHSLVPSLEKAGYTMIHMVPVQERGLSDSPYSIKNQLSLSTDFHSNDNKPREQVLSEMISAARKHNIKVMVDVVWNHTACDSEWLLEHPEAGYTLETAPHLRAALEVDEAMLMYSQRLDGESGRMENEQDLERIMDGFGRVVEELKLEEYFLVDVDSHLSQFQPKSIDDSEQVIELRLLQDGRYDRFSHYIDMDKVNMNCKSVEQLSTAIQKINQQQQQIVNDIKSAIIANTRARVRYERLAMDGPRLGPISAGQPLLSPYFTRLFVKPNQLTAFANNGWVWDADPLVNFAEAPGLAYLRRDIIIWGDCVKLRYGQKPADSPWLWEHMTKYTRLMAEQFDGLRIDNCHSTPLSLAKHLLAEARVVNPQIYIIAELFTGRPETDELFVGELGIDSLIREAMQCGDPADLCRSINRFAAHDSVSTSPHALLMDCTHDNPAPAQKRTLEDAFTTAALVAMAPCATGSVRGFDHFVPEHLNIVYEHRLYALYKELSPIEECKSFIMNIKSEKWKILATERDGLVTIRAFGDKEYILLAKTRFTAHEQSTSYILPDEAKVLYSGRIIVDHQTILNEERIFGSNARIEIVNDFKELYPGTVTILEMPTVNTLPLIEAFYNNADNFACLNSLTISDLNMLLYRTDAEERDMNPPYGVYVVPDFGPLPYCGIAGFVLPIMQNDFGIMNYSDPFTRNASQGTWMLDYTIDRLIARSNDSNVIDRLTRLFTMIKQLSGPRRASETIRAFKHMYHQCINRCRVLLNTKDDLDLLLSLGLVQMYGVVGSTGYHPLEPSASLAAGLPHFATHHMRCWGRDTFTAYKGFFICSGRLKEGTSVIKAFASCLYNGLIPNLLDARRFPRFNSRDAVWWFVYAVVEHAMVEESILEEQVEMRFVDNQHSDYNSWLQLESHYKMSILDIVKQVFIEHAKGIRFRESNAGPLLDAHMRDNGFNMSIHVDLATGLIHGGNPDNCGTWMDKMGHIKNVNEGCPSTPRNGANVEINALCLYSMSRLLELVGDFNVTEGMKLSEWKTKLQTHFDAVYFDPSISCYKDVHDSAIVRPNFLIATALLDLPKDHLQQSIDTAINELLSPDPRSIGIRTLTPKHPAFNPNYSIDDPSGGHNYHNGPEWCWLTGFFLLSLRKLDGIKYHRIHDELVSRINKHVQMNPFGGVAELTNENGEPCRHSCTSQAWSMACLRQALLSNKH